MKTKSMKIVSLLLTMIVLVATFCLFTTVANAAEDTATITFDDTSKRTTFDTSQQVWEENGIRVTNDKASGSNIADYSKPARFYANTKLTIEKTGATISEIVFDCNSGSYATAMKNSIGTVAGASVNVSNDKVTVTFTSPVESFVVAKMSAQVRMDALTVTYTELSTDTPTCEHKNTSKVNNGDGTHNFVCDNCQAVVKTEFHNNSASVGENNNFHKLECADCGAVTEEEHIKKTISSNKETHTFECTVCHLVAEEAHNSETVCTICGWAAPGQEFELTLSFATTATRVSWDANQQIWEQNGIKLVNKKGSGSNIIDSSNPVRFYKNSIITITYPGMTKIVFQCSGGSDFINTLDGNATVDGTTVTVTFDKPVDTYTVTLSEGQIRVSSLTVSGKTPCDHTESAPVYESLNNHNHKVVCADCGEEIAEEAHTIVGLACDKCEYVLPFEFGGWSLTLYDNLSLNYTVNAAFFANGYSNPSATFVIGERTIVVTEYTEKDGKYVFTLSDIAPYQMGVTIQATLTATKDGETVTDTTERTIKAYCMQLLADETQEEAVKTLVVDLLNYGAASQTYVGATDALVNADLTDAQKALGTQGEPALTTVANSAYVKVDNAKVTWVGAQLLLVDTVEMNFVFRAESTESLVVKVVTASGKTYTITEFGAYSEGAYIASFSALNAAQMSEVVDVTVYEGDTAVSNTYRYSIESYACAKQGDADANLASLVKAMMVYGNSAKAYVEALKGANA